MPPSLVESLIESQPEQFGSQHFGPLVLVVRAPQDDDGKFLDTLSICALKDAPPRSQQPGVSATAEFPTMPAGQQEPNEADQTELLSELTAAPHCLVPLKGADRTIQIGRSPNADVVFADPSVSARHAMLHMGDGGSRIVDLGSKNGTTVNNRRLVEGEELWLQSMDRLSFGRIQAFVCAPRALRGVIRQSIRIAF